MSPTTALSEPSGSGISIVRTTFQDGSRLLPAYRLEAATFLPRPLEEVFAFFSNARNLQTLTPPWLDFEILTQGEIPMAPGTLIDYRITVHRLPIRWRTEISEWKPPHSFVDRQLSGPYRLWHHRHGFEERDGGTVATDTVHYWPKGGALVNRLFVQKDVERIFEYRSQQMGAIFHDMRERLKA